MAEMTLELQENVCLEGRYIIKKIIGSGGFGITYKAYDNYNQKNCAIKELFPRGVVTRLADGISVSSLSPDKQKVFEHGKERFLEEAEILQRLGNVKAVVNVYDFFQENGTCYFVMEYLEGINLGQLAKAKGGSLPWEAVADIVSDVGSVLVQVHRMNIFHRDISPDNIFITYQGTVKLIDFGNAKNIVRADGDRLSVVLKPGFAPLEQYSTSGPQGTFTDVYSLACTMYFILTGKKLPDAMDRVKGVRYATLKQFGYPEYISAAVDKALTLRYRERTQTIQEFLNDLRLNYKGRKPDERNISHGNMPSADDKGKAWLQTTMTSTTVQIKAAKTPIPVIDVLSGRQAGMKYKLPVNTKVIIGRNETMAHIVIKEDLYISKSHCEIFFDSMENVFYMVDHSTNGTYVEGKKLVKDNIYQVPVGSRILLGGNRCMLKVGVIYER
ncbi:MAG: FHA domain-containing serine/threonine-protein kinase [Clostridium sp.]|nr:FHA domain-containing serine/threonine-protein kinase [Clostridium sp.]MCM1207466.1 FHA domain-containing serine/threonine-protein kinase [Ruminococcus sp.]